MNRGDHHILRHSIFRIRNTELNELYETMSLRHFALSLISVFIPIYLMYNLRFSIQEILLFYIAVFTAELLLIFPAIKYIAKYGPKHSIALSLPMIFLFFLLLKTWPAYHWPILIIAILHAASSAFFWQAYHIDFSKSKHRSSTTKEVSRMYILLTVIGAFAPFVGGVIASYFGMAWLIVVVMAMFFLAFIPLLKRGELHVGKRLNFKKIHFWNLKRQFVSIASCGYEAQVSGVIWPLFVFSIVGTYKAVGLVTSLSLLVTIMITYLIGRRGDSVIKTKYIKTGGILNGFTYFLKIFTSTIFHVIIYNFITGVSQSILNTPFDAELYLHADEESRQEYIFVTEVVTAVMRITFFLLLYIMSIYLAAKTIYIIGLITGGVACLLIPVMPPAKSEIA